MTSSSFMRQRRALLLRAGASLLLPLPAITLHAQPQDPSLAPAECVIPAKAGGGFDLTCALARDALQIVRPTRPPLVQRFMPGGIGAVAFDRMATGRMGGPDLLVAFSSGSLLNIAQGRFGPHPANAVHWLATLGTDYGVVAVHRDSSYKTLQDVMSAIRRDPSGVVFGAGGTVGSQDWVKSALLVRTAGRDPKAMRFVSFEGGGDALAALQGKHVDVFPGDAAEALQAIAGGAAVRIVAVLSATRLGDALQGIPTAREQGVEIVWPTVRGVYLSANVPRDAARRWAAAFEEALASPQYAALRSRHRLYPFSLTGPAMDDFVARQLAAYREMASTLGLRRWDR